MSTVKSPPKPVWSLNIFILSSVFCLFWAIQPLGIYILSSLFCLFWAIQPFLFDQEGMFEDATLSKWKFEAKVWKWKFEVKVWIFANATLCIVKVKVWSKSVKVKVWMLANATLSKWAAWANYWERECKSVKASESV